MKIKKDHIITLFFFCFILFGVSQNKKLISKKITSDSSISNLRINHLKKPFGIDVKKNSFSFLANEEGPFNAYILLDDEIVQSKTVKLEESVSFTFENDLEYNKKYKYVVEGAYSKNELEFETALDLNAPFIKPKNPEIFSPIFVKNFILEENGEIKRARLYITGLGLYQAFLNGEKVGNAYLTPGYNDYDYYLRYQTYDIKELLSEENKIEIHMGDGWYKGRFGIYNTSTIFGSEYKLCLDIEVEFENDKVVHITTDDTWKVKTSKQIANGIYDGEEVDYTIPDATTEEDVIISKENYTLVPDFGSLMVERKKIRPVLYISPKNEKILDFQQNMVGFVRFNGTLKKDQEVKFSHGEVLNEGCFFNLNYRSAKAILIYKGDGEERVYEPKFSFFGFRYVLVEGLDEVNPEDFEGVVIYTDLEETLEIKTDNEKINKLIKNSLWGQRGNFLDVPTDCPQRDERLGWTADTQVFTNTACFNMDTYIFYRKFLNDLRGDQIMYYEGNIPAFSPSLKKQINFGGSVWADAATIIPWNLYLNYGDKNLLQDFYPLMKDYVIELIKEDMRDENYTHIILKPFTYGDWLALDGPDPDSSFGGTDPGFINTVYYYHSVELLITAAKELGYEEDVKNYTEIKNLIHDAILDHYFLEDGTLNLTTQTSYVLCLRYNLFKDKDLILNALKEKLRTEKYHILTGFTGTPLILLTFFDNGMDDFAYRVLYNEEYPGWLYEVNLNATTIWERWNSLREDGTIGNLEMNSFNHYAYGSVCEAIYTRIAGLRNLVPGWKKVMIKPQINYRMKTIDFAYQSISGKYEIHWKWIHTKFHLTVTIPYGCEAEIVLPDGKSKTVTSGTYDYECDIDKKIYSPFSVDTPLVDLMKNKASMKLIQNELPLIYEQIQDKSPTNEIKKHSINSANDFYKFNYTSEELAKVDSILTILRP